LVGAGVKALAEKRYLLLSQKKSGISLQWGFPHN
jgi:hypothetical protein